MAEDACPGLLAMLVSRSCVVFRVRTVRVRMIDVYAASRARFSIQMTDFTVTHGPARLTGRLEVITGAECDIGHIGAIAAHSIDPFFA
eukprot:120107-Prymnesium_polylepis.1